MRFNGSVPRPAGAGLLEKTAALFLWAVLLVAGFMFSLVLLSVVVVVGAGVWAYVWWKTRALRRAMRECPPDGRVIEGEVVIVDEYSGAEQRRLSDRDGP